MLGVFHRLVLPGQHQVGIGVVGPGPRGAPLDGVDLLTVGLQVVDTRVLLHTPDLVEMEGRREREREREPKQGQGCQHPVSWQHV